MEISKEDATETARRRSRRERRAPDIRDETSSEVVRFRRDRSDNRAKRVCIRGGTQKLLKENPYHCEESFRRSEKKSISAGNRCASVTNQSTVKSGKSCQAG